MKFLTFPFIFLCATPLLAQNFEDFEAYPIGFGMAQMIGANPLDSNTITGTGFGPNLVAPGCAYSTNGADLQWNGNGFLGQTSRNICGSGNTLLLDYTIPVTTLSFTLQVFNTAPDLVTIELYDTAHHLIQRTTGISLVDGTPIPFFYHGTAVAQASLISTTQMSSPILDNHEYGGPSLVLSGSCPGAIALQITGATPNASLAIAYGIPGSFTIPSGPCHGTQLEIANPTLAGFFQSDNSGAFSLNFPGPSGLCGITVQVVDMATCLASQTAVL